MPTRGNARKIGVRVESRPVLSPRQNGEFADSASSSGTCTRIPLRHVDRLVGVVDAHVHVDPKMISWRATNWSPEIRSR